MISLSLLWVGYVVVAALPRSHPTHVEQCQFCFSYSLRPSFEVSSCLWNLTVPAFDAGVISHGNWRSIRDFNGCRVASNLEIMQQFSKSVPIKSQLESRIIRGLMFWSVMAELKTFNPNPTWFFMLSNAFSCNRWQFNYLNCRIDRKQWVFLQQVAISLPDLSYWSQIISANCFFSTFFMFDALALGNWNRFSKRPSWMR